MDKPSPEPRNRFTGLADIYAKSRPGYPQAAVDYIRETCRLPPQAVIADVGCGTGISSRLFAQLGYAVIGVEPNTEMRSQAEAGTRLENLRYQDGSAENTDLPEASVDLVLSAQAFHWFKPGE